MSNFIYRHQVIGLDNDLDELKIRIARLERKLPSPLSELRREYGRKRD